MAGLTAIDLEPEAFASRNEYAERAPALAASYPDSNQRLTALRTSGPGAFKRPPLRFTEEAGQTLARPNASPGGLRNGSITLPCRLKAWVCGSGKVMGKVAQAVCAGLDSPLASLVSMK